MDIFELTYCDTSLASLVGWTTVVWVLSLVTSTVVDEATITSVDEKTE